MKINEVISKYIEQKHISVREFARRCRLSNTYIGNLMNSEDKNPSLDVMSKIALGMGITSKDLFALLDDDQEFIVNTKSNKINIPLYSPLCCGYGCFYPCQLQ